MSRTTGRRVLDSIVERARTSTLDNPAPSVQSTALEKSDLGMKLPVVASVARVTQMSGLDTSQILS
jgi:hypothetical protein